MCRRRMALVGFGGMGSWHARNVIEKVPALQVVGAFDIQEEPRHKAEAMGLRAYSSFEELLSDSSIDLITVATPNDSHMPLSIAALKAGKNVVCEKPVTLNADELTQVIKARDESGKVFSIHHNRRWDKDFCVVKAAYQQGLLGQVYFVESKVQGSRGAMHGWRGHKLNGGGMLLDWGIHLLDQMLQLIDSPVVEADAHLLSIFTPEVDDNIKLLLRFENGASALMEMSTNCLINAPRWHVQGSGGTLRVDDWDGAGTLRQLKENAEMEWADDIVYTAAGPTRTMAPRPAFTMNAVDLPTVHADWAEFYQNIVDTLDGKAQLAVKPEEALRVMRVVDLLFRANAEGCSQKCRI